MTAIAIDLGGTRIKIGLVQQSEIIATTKINARPDTGIGENLDDISKVVRELLREHNIPTGSLRGIGLTFPGIVDTVHNRVISKYVKYTNAHMFDFETWAKQNWNLPIVLENDARAALLGEWRAGAGKGYNSIVLLTLGTGVGSGVLIEGKLLRGVNYIAGNLAGHMSVHVDGKPCNCGFFGCLETEASTWALPEKAASHPDIGSSSLKLRNTLEFADLFEAADQGDAVAKDILESCLKAWGVGAVNMVHAYDPEVIIVGGGIMKRKDKILPVLQHMVDEYAWLFPGTTKIVAAQQVEYAGLIGMEYLVSQIK